MDLSNVRKGWVVGTVGVILSMLPQLGCAGGVAASVPDGPPVPLTAAEYYPLQTGWKWSYDIEKDGQHILAFYSVIARVGDSATVQVGEDRLSYAITTMGVAHKEEGVVGDFLLKDPLTAGASWTLAQGRAQVVSIGQVVTVLAGTFKNCVVIEETRSDPMRIVRTTFAPAVGPISVEVEEQDGVRFVTTTKAILRGMNKPGQDPLAM